MLITDECINCQACTTECPNDAIREAGIGYEIGGKAYEPISEVHSYIIPVLCDSCGTCKDSCSIGAIES